MDQEKNSRVGFQAGDLFRKLWMPLVFPMLCVAVVTYVFPFSPRGLRWPLRLISLPFLIWSLVGLATLSRLLIEWWPAMAKAFTRLEWPEKWRWRWEVSWAALLFIVAGAHFFLVAQSMSTALLNIDEIGTIKLYSAQGAAKVITNYGLAKNHILFNLANSLLPGSGSFDPIRARLFSFLATTLTWLALAWYGWKRRRLLECGLVAGLIGLNQQLLQLDFQARGYGFIFCFALIGSYALCEYLRTGRYLWLLGLTVALGSYTVPSYLVFGGSLMLLLFLTTRRAAVFRAGVLTLGITIFLYFPVLGQLLHVTASYDEAYGEKYRNFKNICDTLAYCIPPFWTPNELGFFAALVLLSLVPLILRPALRAEWRGVALLLASSALFITFCLLIKTPPARVTAFLAAPVLISFALIIGAGLRHSTLRWLQPPAVALLFGSLAWFGVETIRRYDFNPQNNLADGGQMAINLAPANGVLWVSSGATSLSVYLEKICRVVSGPLPQDRFVSGQALLFEENGQTAAQSLAEQTPGAKTFPVFRGKRIVQRLFFLPPPASGIASVALDGQPADPKILDRDFDSGVSLAAAHPHRLDCEASSSPIRSFNLISQNGWANTQITVQIESSKGKIHQLASEHILIEDKLLSLDLRGGQTKKIHILLSATGQPLDLTEIFAIGEK